MACANIRSDYGTFFWDTASNTLDVRYHLFHFIFFFCMTLSMKPYRPGWPHYCTKVGPMTIYPHMPITQSHWLLTHAAFRQQRVNLMFNLCQLISFYGNPPLNPSSPTQKKLIKCLWTAISNHRNSFHVVLESVNPGKKWVNTLAIPKTVNIMRPRQNGCH